MNRFNIVLGDWSDDGHGKTKEYTIETDCTKQEISEAYKRGVEIIGFDLCDDVAEDYEESEVSLEYEEMLNRAGIKPEEYLDAYDLKDREKKKKATPLNLWYESYFYLWKKFVEVGNPPHPINQIECEEIKIGGYGLFH